MALKLAQIVATGNGVFKLVSMFEDATAAAASAPQTGQTERNINKYKRQERMDVYFKDQMVLKHFFFPKKFWPKHQQQLAPLNRTATVTGKNSNGSPPMRGRFPPFKFFNQVVDVLFLLLFYSAASPAPLAQRRGRHNRQIHRHARLTSDKRGVL